MGVTLWLALTAISLMGADDKDAVKKELDKFRGKWEFVSLEVNGQKLPEEQAKGATLTLDGDKFTYVHTGANEKGSGIFKVDVSKKPKHIDVTFNDGPDKGKTLLGIYELTSDTYKVCIGMPGKDRPKEFATKPDSGHVLEVLKKVKDK